MANLFPIIISESELKKSIKQVDGKNVFVYAAEASILQDAFKRAQESTEFFYPSDFYYLDAFIHFQDNTGVELHARGAYYDGRNYWYYIRAIDGKTFCLKLYDDDIPTVLDEHQERIPFMSV